MAFNSMKCKPHPNPNTTLQRFDGRYWHLDFPLSSVCTIVSESPTELEVNCEFRSNRDLAGLLWTSYDKFGHPLLAYMTDNNYEGVKLGFIANPQKPYNFTVTIGLSGGNVYRLYPYKVSGEWLVPNVTNSLVDGTGPGTSYLVSDIFPNGILPLGANEHYFILDFDNLKLGFDYSGEKVSPTNIDQLFISITPKEYGFGSGTVIVDDVGSCYYWGDDLIVYKTKDIDWVTLRGVNPNFRFKRGDYIEMSITVPDQYRGLGGISHDQAAYSYKVQKVIVQVTEWTGDGTTVRSIKLPETIKGALWLDGRASALAFQADTAIGSESVQFIVRNISPTGARSIIGKRFYPQEPHNMQMTSGYDDTYNITPYRQVDNTYNLGYRGHFTIYMGMSHYFKAFSVGTANSFILEVIKDAEEPLNYPTEVWCRNLFVQMQRYNYVFVWSTSYEILDSYMPPEWKQRDAFGSPALSGWVPPSSFIIPSKKEPLEYLGRTINHGLKLLQEAGITKLMFQIGEPWWWDGSYTNGAPCIYDEHTKALYKQETGNDVPTPYYTNYTQDVTPNQRHYLQWLGDKLGWSTNYIRDFVKASYPQSEATLLFFTPQIMNPSSEFLSIINFPITYWVYPEYDFVQIEDYDWIIYGNLDLLPLTIEAARDKLGYPLEVIHYFVGFVLTEQTPWIWPNINIATKNAIEWEIPQIYVWAYPQVIRDQIIYDDSLYGSEVTIPEPNPYIRDVVGLEDAHVKPAYLCKVGEHLFLNSTDKNIQYDGKLWLGVGTFGSVGTVTEASLLSDQGWTLALTNLPPLDVLSLTNQLRFTRVDLYLVLLTADNYMQINPRLIASGMVHDSAILIDEGLVNVSISVKSKLSNWSKLHVSSYTDSFQRSLYPDDGGFSFVNDLASKKIKWGL